MPRAIIDLEGFDQKFRNDSDPWNYKTSRFEAFKRSVLMHACGDRQFGRGLELACANGENTVALARKCLDLLALDGSPAAVSVAQDRTSNLRNVRICEAALPEEMPRGPFDLIVISELLYYLSEQNCGELLMSAKLALSPGGRIVVLHHTIPFDDVAILPARAQERARSLFGATMKQAHRNVFDKFEVVAYQKSMR